MDTHAEECRCFLFADVPLLSLCLRLRRSGKPGNHTACNPVDERLFMQSGEGQKFPTEQANKGVRYRNIKTPRLIASGSLCV